MFGRSLVAGLFVFASVVGVAGCQDVNQPDAPYPPGGSSAPLVIEACKDDIGSEWKVEPAESTVDAGERIHFVVNRNGTKYTSGPGAAVVDFDAPQGGTLADPSGIETDYAAGSIPGDYTVVVVVTDPMTRKTTCSLRAIVHVRGKGANTGNGGPAAPLPPNATKVDLSGTWSFSHDANKEDDPTPILTLGGVSSSAVSVGYNGRDGMSCGCNAEHKVIKLPKSFDCSSTTLAFDYQGSGTFGFTSNQAISIRFCKGGTCSQESFYGGDQFKASQQSGNSNCAWEWGNKLPASPMLKAGHNVVDLGKLSKEQNGSCSGSFDAIDVHLQAYACFAGQDSGTQTLSNLVLY